MEVSAPPPFNPQLASISNRFNLPLSFQKQVPAALSLVLLEKGVKMQNERSRRGINLVYLIFWISIYQLLCVALMFWVNILPGSGNPSIADFGTR